MHQWINIIINHYPIVIKTNLTTIIHHNCAYQHEHEIYYQH